MYDKARPHLQFGSAAPDVASSDYHLLRSMQHGLADARFRNGAEVREVRQVKIFSIWNRDVAKKVVESDEK